MSWLLLTIIAIFIRATYGIASKVLTKNVDASSVTQTVLMTTLAGFISLLASPFMGGFSLNGTAEVLWLILGMVSFISLGNIFYFKGVKMLDAGTAQIAFSSLLIWGVLLSIIFLGSNFSIKQFWGIILLFMAILMVSNLRGKHKIDKGLVYMLVAAIFFACFQAATAVLSRHINSATFTVTAFFGSSLFLSAAYWKAIVKELRNLKKARQKTFVSTFFASTTGTLHFVFTYLAYQHAPDRGVVLVLLTSQVVLSVIFGIIFLKENQDIVKKLTAGALAFVAGALIKS